MPEWAGQQEAPQGQALTAQGSSCPLGVRGASRHRGPALWGAPGHTVHGIHHTWRRARLVQCLLCPYNRQLWEFWEVAWIGQVSGNDGEAPPARACVPLPAWAGPGLTHGHQSAAVPLVEVGPGFVLAVLAAGQDAIAACARSQAHANRAAALAAELKERNPARGHAGVGGVPDICAPGPGPLPVSSAWAVTHR